MKAVVKLAPLVVSLGLLAVPAWAQAPIEVAEVVATDGYYVEPGLDVSGAELRDLARKMQERGLNFASVVLAEDVGGGADLYADTLLDLFEGQQATIVVLTPGELGFASDEFSQEQLDQAADRSLAMFDTNIPDGFTLFADTLSPGVAAGPSESSAGFPWALVFIVGGLVLVVFYFLRSQNKKEKERRVEDVKEARAEIKHQLDEIANEILDDADLVRISDNAEAKQYFEAASQTYADATETFEKATTLNELEEISDRLDKARWQLAASDALREGKEVPPEPKEERATCFFDPAHPPATETAILETSAGKREVKVCPADAERLRQGEQPRARSINVGGRPVPAPMAPKSYGGGGFGMMDFFRVILGGMAASGGFGGSRPARPHARRHRRYTRNREIFPGLPPPSSRSGGRRSSRRSTSTRRGRTRRSASGRRSRRSSRSRGSRRR